MGTVNGCTQTVVVIITAIITVLLGFFSDPTPYNSLSGEENFPFIVAQESVDYDFAETFNCQFEISGSVEFLDEYTLDRENIVIQLQPLATYDDRPAATAYLGSDDSYGLIVVGSYGYLVWVHDLTLDMPLSEKFWWMNSIVPMNVFVQQSTCDN